METATGEGELDVHRPTVHPFEVARDGRHLLCLRFGQRRAQAQEPGHVDLADPPVGGDAHAAFVGVMRRYDRERRLVDVPHVRGDRAADDALTQPPTGAHDDDVAALGHGVRAEGHARHVRWHHVLHQHGQCHAVDAQAMTPAVRQRGVGTQRTPGAVDGGHDGVEPDHVEMGVVLTGERGEGTVLVDGRGAHGDGPVLLVPNQARVRLAHVMREFVREAAFTGRHAVGLGREAEALGNGVRRSQAAQLSGLGPHQTSIGT